MVNLSMSTDLSPLNVEGSTIDSWPRGVHENQPFAIIDVWIALMQWKMSPICYIIIYFHFI